MRAEIWLSRMTAHFIEDVKSVEVSDDGVFVKITNSKGYTWETSPRNVLILSEPKDGGE